MSKLYFIGGESIVKRDAKEINASAFNDSGGSPSILVFSWARPSFDVSFRRRRSLVNYFRSLGASNVEFAEFFDSPDLIKSKLAKSNLVYLTGGQVGALLSRLRDSGVERLLRQYQGVLVGRSAGAVALGRECFVRNRYSGRRKMVAGLGLVDFSVKVHYDSSLDKLLLAASNKGKIFALPQGSGLSFDSGSLSFFGAVFLFLMGKKLLVGHTSDAC